MAANERDLEAVERAYDRNEKRFQASTAMMAALVGAGRGSYKACARDAVEAADALLDALEGPAVLHMELTPMERIDQLAETDGAEIGPVVKGALAEVGVMLNEPMKVKGTDGVQKFIIRTDGSIEHRPSVTLQWCLEYIRDAIVLAKYHAQANKE